MLSQIYHPNPLLGIDYASYSPSLSRFYHPPTPPYTYPYDYQQIYGPQKSEDRLRINLDIYPHFPSPPLSVSPPQEESIPLSKTAASENCRTTSVIMRVSDQKIVEPKSDAEEEFICRWIHCSRQFDSLDSLASHVTQTHAIASFGGLYFCCWEGCPRTDRGFNARYKMLVHVRTHTKEKPHQCPLCEKSFSRAENLKIHTRSHSGEKPYRCPVEGCNKAYSNSSDRFKHTRTHSTEKPYVCKVPGCQKRYTDPSSLRKHVKTFKHTPIIENCDASRTTVKPSPPPRTEEKVSLVNYQNYSTEILERAKVPLCSEVSCGPECFDHHYHNNPRIYTFGSYVSEVFPSYDSQSDKTPSPPSYWINSGTHKIDVEEEEMDLDLPLDLSMNRSHR